MQQILISTVVASVISSAIAYGVTTEVLSNSVKPETMDDSQIVVVDFKNLSQRLMVTMREQISQQDLSNPELIDLMAQNEARRLYRQVVEYNPNAVVLNKTSLVSAPDSLDITDAIADAMGLDEVSAEALQQFMNGQKVNKPVGVK